MLLQKLKMYQKAVTTSCFYDCCSYCYCYYYFTTSSVGNV